MGPHSFKCGKSAESALGLPLSKGFNGAALFQVRKDLGAGVNRLQHLTLEWGRTLSSAERFFKKHPHLRGWMRFNGAALFQVRKVVLEYSGLSSLSLLQWGRTLSSAESNHSKWQETGDVSVPGGPGRR